jgi:hypothetical protein
MATDWTPVLVVVTTSATTLGAVALTYVLTRKADRNAAAEARRATLVASRAAAYATLMASLRDVQRWMIQCYPLFTASDYKPPEMPSGESRGAAIVAVDIYGSRAVQHAFTEITSTIGEFVTAANTLTFRAAHPGSAPDVGDEPPHAVLERTRMQMSDQLSKLAELVSSEVQGDSYEAGTMTQP